MSGLKEVRGRIASINSTQQITKAMKMVSASKLRKAQSAIVQIRPYTAKLKEVIGNVQANLTGDIELELGVQRPAEKILVVVMSSDKGLCGGFNMNLYKTARQLINEKYAEQKSKGQVTIMALGKKSADAFRKFEGIKLESQYLGIFSKAFSFQQTSAISESLMQRFIAGEFDVIEVVFSEFRNAVVQIPQGQQFLPLVSTQVEVKKGSKADYLMEPDQAYIIRSLIPSYLKIQFHRYMLDTNASEHGARMTSMDKATENAGDLLKQLKLQYNRARQAAITKEISEIAGGVAALEG
jgi:F-type H+-transporting ATPase subunit gamma